MSRKHLAIHAARARGFTWRYARSRHAKRAHQALYESSDVGHQRFRQRKYLTVCSAIAVLCGATLGGLTLGGVTFASPATNTYSACLVAGILIDVHVNATPTCGHHETLITWNEQGPKGTTGAKGTPGAPGTGILNGTTAPTTQGVTGDFYLDTATEVLYGPKAGGTWPGTGTSLVGPKGTKGTKGTSGTLGPVCTSPGKGTDLVGCTFVDHTFNTAKLTGANLANATLTHASLKDADLVGANLTGAVLAYAGLYHADLVGANLTDATLGLTTLTDANLTGANLTGAYMYGATLAFANLHYADLTGAADLTSVTFTRTTCPDGTTSTADLDGTTCIGHLTP
jgi:hypothetical protein